MHTAIESARTSDEHFRNGAEQLLAELERVDILIQHYMKNIEQLYSSPDTYRGLYITGDDVNSLLQKPIGDPWWSLLPSVTGNNDIQEMMDGMLENIDRKAVNAKKKGVFLEFTYLTDKLKLDRIEKDILIICLAPEIDIRYELIYAYLQDDITKKYPSIDLVLNLLCKSVIEKLEFRKYVMPDAKLLRYKLIAVANDSTRGNQGFLGRVIQLEDRVVNFLLGNDGLDNKLQNFVQSDRNKMQLNDLPVPADFIQHLSLLTKKVKANNENAIFYLQGPVDSGLQNIAEAISGELGLKPMVVDMASVLKSENIPFSELIRLLVRESCLQNAHLYLSGFDILFSNENDTKLYNLLNIIGEYSETVFLSGAEHWEPKSILAAKPFYRIIYPKLSPYQRAQSWEKLSGQYRLKLSKKNLLELASQYNFTHGQINTTLVTAKNIALLKNHQTSEISINELRLACHANTSRKLSSLAKKIEPGYSWDDIVLSRDKLKQLEEMRDTIKCRAVVYEEWGYSEKLSLGMGLNALFCGPSGTGKTMAAEIIANSLGLEFYKIDLSSIVSKYIGETEKNLSRIFAEAESSNVILFFDEADSLFGKRTEVKDAHDRFANIETSYLLQKMEEHDGIVILASNLRNNIDDAFVRRLYSVIEFPFPDEKHRKKIWRGIFPPEVPLSDSIDFDFLARQFKLSGGNIKNIGLCAAFLGAADNDAGVTMDHLILATKREYQKLNKPCTEADFGNYYELIR